jgi:ligand-binding sensor domain-containing protein
VLFSCIENRSSHALDKQAAAPVGDTVKELGANIMVIYHDKNNNHWFGSWESGLYRYDGKTIIHYSTDDILSDNRIDEIKEDILGNVFFNNRGVMIRFDGEQFRTLSTTSSSSTEWALKPDDVWFKGIQDSGLVYRYDGKQVHRLRFPRTKAGDEHTDTFPNVGYSPYDVYTIYKDSKGNVWFGTASLGVCLYNGRTFTWLGKNDLAFDVETSFGIRSIIEDSDGKFMFSNSLHRYRVYGEDNDISYALEKGIGSLDGRTDGDLVAIMSMVRDGDDLWMATYRQGVWRYNGRDIVHFPVQNKGEDITVYSIYRDNSGKIWLGTHDNGAYHFNGKTFDRFAP